MALHNTVRVRMFCISVFLSLNIISISSGLDLGHGGVYDNPAAQKYWEERFGDLGAARQIQEQGEVSLLTEKEALDGTFAESAEKLQATTAAPALLASAESLQPSSSLLAVQSPVSPYSVLYFPFKVQPLYPLLTNHLTICFPKNIFYDSK